MKFKVLMGICLAMVFTQSHAEMKLPPKAQMAILPTNPIWVTGVSQPEAASYSKSYPVAAESEHYKVVNAGYWITRRTQNLEVVYEFTLSIRKPFSNPVFTRVTLDNPNDALKPTVYEGSINPALGEKSTRALHGPVTGLVAGRTYQMKIQVFSDAARSVQIEEVIQSVVSPLSEKDGCISMDTAAQEAIKLPFPLVCSQ